MEVDTWQNSFWIDTLILRSCYYDNNGGPPEAVAREFCFCSSCFSSSPDSIKTSFMAQDLSPFSPSPHPELNRSLAKYPPAIGFWLVNTRLQHRVAVCVFQHVFFPLYSRVARSPKRPISSDVWKIWYIIAMIYIRIHIHIYIYIYVCIYIDTHKNILAQASLFLLLFLLCCRVVCLFVCLFFLSIIVVF